MRPGNWTSTHQKTTVPLDSPQRARVSSAGLRFDSEILIATALLCGAAVIGFATVGTNLWFMFTARPRLVYALREHVKGLIGTGISVYTAFLAFGAVRFVPELALHPGLWAIPLVTGLATIIWHWAQLNRAHGTRKSIA